MEDIAILDEDEVLGFDAHHTAGVLEREAELLEAVAGGSKDFLGDPREIFLCVVGHDVRGEVVDGLFGQRKAKGRDGDGEFGEVVPHTKTTVEETSIALGLPLEDKQGIFAIFAVEESGGKRRIQRDGEEGLIAFLEGQVVSLKQQERGGCPTRGEKRERDIGQKRQEGADTERPEQKEGRGFPQETQGR